MEIMIGKGRHAMTRKRKTTDAVEILHKRYVKGDPRRKAALEVERANADIAQMIHDVRVDVGLTQKQLAKMIGTTQSVVSRLENADYEGHSLSMLRRVAKALGKRVRVLMPTASIMSESKRWRGLTVDAKLKDTWLERLNALSMLKIIGTCAGHPEEPYWTEQWPQVWFILPTDKAKLADKIICKLAKAHNAFVQALPGKRGWRGTIIYAYHFYSGPSDMKEQAAQDWWEEIIATLEAIQRTCRRKK